MASPFRASVFQSVKWGSCEDHIGFKKGYKCELITITLTENATGWEKWLLDNSGSSVLLSILKVNMFSVK